jgi:hypothetical protein
MRAGKLILGVQALLAARASRSAAPCRSPDEAISPETTSCVATRESARWPSDGPKGREISLPDPPTGSTPCVPSTRLHQTPALMNLFGASARSPHRLLRPPARARERRPPPRLTHAARSGARHLRRQGLRAPRAPISGTVAVVSDNEERGATFCPLRLLARHRDHPAQHPQPRRDHTRECIAMVMYVTYHVWVSSAEDGYSPVGLGALAANASGCHALHVARRRDGAAPARLSWRRGQDRDQARRCQKVQFAARKLTATASNTISSEVG